MNNNYDSYRSYLKFTLRKDIEKNNLNPDPTKRLIIDGKRHRYSVCRNGKKYSAYYEANYDSFGRNNLVLVGIYGLEGFKRYAFSKSVY